MKGLGTRGEGMDLFSMYWWYGEFCREVDGGDAADQDLSADGLRFFWKDKPAPRSADPKGGLRERWSGYTGPVKISSQGREG